MASAYTARERGAFEVAGPRGVANIADAAPHLTNSVLPVPISLSVRTALHSFLLEYLHANRTFLIVPFLATP